MLNALITSLVISTSVASAAPCEQPVAKPVAIYREPARTTWHKPITLVAKDAQFANDGRAFLHTSGYFDKLTITADQGRTYVKQVMVRFADGKDIPVRDINQQLSYGGSLTVDLPAHGQVKEIVVYGSSSGRNADFNVTAV